MRFMEWIRQKGGTCMAVFLIIFVITLFAGLTIGGSLRGCTFREQPQQESGDTVGATLSQDKDLAGVVMRVNGRTVDQETFDERVKQLMDDYRGRSEDPEMQLFAYGNAAQSLIAEEITAEKGDELDVEVTDKDLADARDEAINQMMSSNDNSTGNVLGDIAQKIGSRRERKAAFYQYLEISGLNEQQWRQTAERGLYMRKAREAWQAQIDAEKERKADETKAIIDQKLADGESFADLSKEYSEDPNANGEPVPMGRGLVLPEQEEPLFNTPVGEMTDWIKIPAGWCRFEITDRKMAEGEDFEKERPKIIENLKGDNPDYEPTEDEIKRQYERVSARQIMLKTSVPGAVDEKLKDEVDKAQVQINEPYVLAFQALTQGKLQPVSGFDYDKLVSIAKTAVVGEDYDFSLIQDALDKGGFKAAPAAEEEAGAAGESGEAAPAEGEAAAAEGEAAPAEDEAAEGTEEAATDEQAEQEKDPPAAEAADAQAQAGQPGAAENEQPTPIYALAIGLFKLAIQDDEDKVGPFPYYMIGRTYTDWLADDKSEEQQPLDRDQARQEIEDNFARAAEGMDYAYYLHAERGLNLAWLQRKDDALASLDLAIKYAPQDYQLPIWEQVRKAYEVLDDQDKLDEFNKMMDDYRQAAIQKMIEQAQSKQQQSQAVSIPAEGEGTTTGEEGKAGGEGGAGDASESGAEEGTAANGDESANGDGTESGGAGGEEQPAEPGPPESEGGEKADGS